MGTDVPHGVTLPDGTYVDATRHEQAARNTGGRPNRTGTAMPFRLERRSSNVPGMGDWRYCSSHRTFARAELAVQGWRTSAIPRRYLSFRIVNRNTTEITYLKDPS